MSQPIKKAIFPVGGLGTRFLPATKAIAKEMLPVVDKPLIQYAFDEAVAAGIEQFIFVTGRNKNAISNHFDHSYELQRVLSEKNKEIELTKTKGWMPDAGSIVFTRQQEPLGLGHAVWCARHWIGDDPFAVLLADDMVLSNTPCMSQMIEAYKRAPGNMAAVMDVPHDQTDRYGILDVAEEDGDIVKARGLVEKPKPEDAPSNLSIIGRYILQPSIFDYLGRKEKGSGGEIQLTDAMDKMIDTVNFYGFRFEGTRFDCGERVGFIEANVAYALERDDMRERVLERLQKYC